MILGFGIKDIIDIFLVAYLMYQFYKLMRETGTLNIFIGIMTIIFVWFLVAYVFKMQLLGSILDKVVSVGSIALVVIFQSEIRRFLIRMGSEKNWKLVQKIKSKFFSKNSEESSLTFPVLPLVLACQNMAKTRTGALIIIERKMNLQEYMDLGERFYADVNAQLIESIFFKNSPLHDGALIISNEKIKAARCVLPVSKKTTLPKQFGLRHRAAIGFSELTDALVIVVSEETGNILFAYNGKWKENLTAEQLKNTLIKKLKKE